MKQSEKPPLSVTVRALAKLNLDLHVFARRPDNYHEIETVFQSIALHDTLTLRRKSGPMTVRCRLPGIPKDQSNLVWKAAKILWGELGHQGGPMGVEVRITKRIPMAAGLGGGSSDAASALRGLCALWDVVVPLRRLKMLASQVGADVPFFLEGGVVLGRGRGDRLRKLADLDPYWVLLMLPHFGVETATAYRWFDSATQVPLLASTRPPSWRRHLNQLRNDLEFPVLAHHPELGVMLDRLRRSGAEHAAMTGSGSTLFSLYCEQTSAREAQRSVRSPGWRTLLTRVVGRKEFERSMLGANHD